MVVRPHKELSQSSPTHRDHQLGYRSIILADLLGDLSQECKTRKIFLEIAFASSVACGATTW